MDILDHAKRYRAVIQDLLNTAGDEIILKEPNLADNWKTDKDYVLNAVVRYEGMPYRCLQPHKSQATWKPDVSPSIWTKILTQEGQILPWEQPSSTNGYSIGDKVTHKDKTWISLVDNNVWEPGVAGTENLWSEV